MTPQAPEQSPQRLTDAESPVGRPPRSTGQPFDPRDTDQALRPELQYKEDEEGE